jgi:hypothetical protein
VSGLVLADHFVHPKNQFPLTARRYMAPLFGMQIPFLKGPALTGDCQLPCAEESHFLTFAGAAKNSVSRLQNRTHSPVVYSG